MSDPSRDRQGAPGAEPESHPESPPFRAKIRFSRRATNGINLHVAEAGPATGLPVLLLHGFPEFWYGWRHQIDALANAGYHVIAPDQRGYNLSDRPHGIAAYDLDVLARDIIGLADALGLQKFSLVGHDWGGLVAWWIATLYPDRLARFVALAAPHPAIWIDAMENTPEQRKLSWYVKAFRPPWLPEFLLRQGQFRPLAEALGDSRRPAGCTNADLAQYRQVWARPGALTGMVDWYRAILAKRLTLAAAGPIEVPGLVVWGNGDKYGLPELARRSAALCAQVEVVTLDTSHWIQHDDPARVNALLLDFLGKQAAPDSA